MKIRRFTIAGSVFRTIRGIVEDRRPRMVDLDIIKRPRLNFFRIILWIVDKIREATTLFLDKTRHHIKANPTLKK